MLFVLLKENDKGINLYLNIPDLDTFMRVFQYGRGSRLPGMRNGLK